MPGEGPPEAPLFLIGEAPGRREDESGRPFVGIAGRVLTNSLREAGLERSKVFITNAVKCRPPDNRSPRAEELDACRPYLLRQLQLVQPRVIVTLGTHALRVLGVPRGKVADQRGKSMDYGGVPVVSTYHPGAVRYGKGRKAQLVEDLRRAAEIAGVLPHGDG